MNLDNVEKVIILGGGKGIGLAMTKEVLSRYEKATLYVTYRSPSSGENLKDLSSERVREFKVDPTNESELSEFCELVKVEPGDLGLVINCVGFLTENDIRPEKNLAMIDSGKLLKYFEVNANVTIVLAKYIKKMLPKSFDTAFVSLSAKVGSIEDNNIGGWYGYRASKAALNMFLKTIAIELKNYGCRTNVLAIHPGTTITDLSEPYIKRTKLQLHTAEDSANNIMNVIEKVDYSPSARFYNWDSSLLPW